MIKFLLFTNMCSLIAITWFAAGQPRAPLFNTVVLDSIECPEMSGVGGSVAGVGLRTSGRPDQECNDARNVQLMLAANMPNNAKIGACQTDASMRQFANQDNCMNADKYGWAKIAKDVAAKRQACGGKEPKWYHPRKKAKFKSCIGALI